MLKGRKILVTGVAGNIAFPLARSLAADNEVWGISLLDTDEEHAKVATLGITARAIDLASGEYGDLPTDFDYVLHLAADTGGVEFYRTVEVNAGGTALLMNHCRSAKAFLSMSAGAAYSPHVDPWHAFAETDPLGGGYLPVSPHYAVSKVVQESIARTFARQLGLPTIIPRMNVAYGNDGRGGMPGYFLEAIRAGQPVMLRGDPYPFSPIHDRDIADQVEAMLAAASVDAPIVNWGGDEAVTAQEICAHFGELLGVEPMVRVQPVPNTLRGVVADNSRRIAITGPCRVTWRDGVRELVEAHHP